MSLPSVLQYNLCRPADDPTCNIVAIEYAPDPDIFPGPQYPIALIVHGGGFHGGGPTSDGAVAVSEDARSKGYLAISISYRVVGGKTNGQTTDGTYPQMVNDVKLAAKCVRLDLDGAGGTKNRYNGTLVVIGDSAGGFAAMCLAVHKTSNLSPLGTDRNGNSVATWGASDRPDAIVSTSGCYQMADRTPVTYTPDPYKAFKQGVWGFCGVTSDSAPNLAIMLANSPYSSVVDTDIKPCLLFHTEHDPMPAPQMDVIAAKFDEVGFTDYTTQRILGSAEHSFDYWSHDNSAGTAVNTQAWDWLDGVLGGGGGGGGTPPPPGKTNGVLVNAGNLSGGQGINQGDLDSPDTDGIGFNVAWSEFEPTEGDYQWDLLLQPIKQAAAAGKWVGLHIGTMGGSKSLKGSTPDWVFDAMAADPGIWDDANKKWLLLPGDFSTGFDANGTVSTDQVKSYKAYFSSLDVGSVISGTNIPDIDGTGGAYIGSIDTAGGPGIQGIVNLVDGAGDPVLLTGSPGSLSITNRPKVGKDSHDIVWGRTYTFIDGNDYHGGDPLTTIPVFWDRVYVGKKINMISALGEWAANTTDLTQSEKQAIRYLHVAWANAITEDMNIPSDPKVFDLDGLPNQLARWLNAFDAADPTQRGAGYTTELMLHTAVKFVPHINEPSKNMNVGGSTSSDILTWAAGTTHTDPYTPLQKFTRADVGTLFWPATGNTIFQDNTKIEEYIDSTHVRITAPPKINMGAGTQVQVNNRRNSFLDVWLNAAPNALAWCDVHNTGKNLDKTAAQAAGYSGDAGNYQADTIVTNTHALYPSRIVGASASIAATTPVAPPNQGGNTFLLWDWHTRGISVGGQALWYCYQDPTYRMNGGDNTDKRIPGNTLTDGEIWLRSATNLYSYGAIVYEVYERDVLNLPDTLHQIHQLFTGQGGGGGGGGGGSGIVGGDNPIPELVFNTVSYLEEIEYQIASLLNVKISSAEGPSSDQVARWSRFVNKHVRYAWRFWEWPFLELIEERAIGPVKIWNDIDVFVFGDRVFYLGEVDDDGNLIDTGYYTATGLTIEKGTPPSDGGSFSPYDLTALDFYLPLQQTCRWKIGDVFGLYPYDPRQVPVAASPYRLDWRRSNRGIEILGWGAGQTVFLKHRVEPFKYIGSNGAWSASVAYSAGDLALYQTDGNVYRAIIDTAGGTPDTSSDWAVVPFPEAFANYVVYNAAADDCDDRQTANEWRTIAAEYLRDEVDKLAIQTPPKYYSFARRRASIATTSFPIVTDVAADGGVTIGSFAGGVAGSTIYPYCLDPWGAPIP